MTAQAAAAKRELAIRAELLGIKPEALPSLGEVYDFSDFSAIDRVRISLASWRPAR